MHVFGRRGPLQVKFTPLELRELGEVPGADIVVAEEDFDRDPDADAEAKKNKQILVIDRIFSKWRGEDAERTGPRRLHLHFWARPAAVLADDEGRVRALRIERTAPGPDGSVVGTGEFREIEVGQVYRAVGYHGPALDEVPYDADRGVIPNDGGSVVDAEGERVGGVYATGWIKRGPVGLIGHTKSDAKETIEHLLAEESSWWTPSIDDRDSIAALLDERGVRYTDLDGWHRLDAHERALGEAVGRERIKVVDREEMLRISRGE